MFGWAITFLIVALVAAILGFGGIAGVAIEAAKLIFFVAIILFRGRQCRCLVPRSNADSSTNHDGSGLDFLRCKFGLAGAEVCRKNGGLYFLNSVVAGKDGARRSVRPEIIHALDRHQFGKACSGAIDAAFDRPYRAFADCRRLLIGKPRRSHEDESLALLGG